ncbi:MAG: transglutaminase family protein [Bauldia sp.]|nr:MAG: transglutaminase family protein [Bauldia sp.]MBZ0229682.1 transglutaminase family protein [Bauldia sp.]
MRLRIRHETAYRYESPASRTIQVVRLTPRGHDGQFVVGWRIEVDHDCRLDASADPFGNTVHSFTVEGPLDGLVIAAEGEIETRDTHGIVSGQVERMPPQVFLRDTALTEADAAIRDLADTAAAFGGDDPIKVMHEIMNGIRARMRFEINATDTGTTAREAFFHGRGVCQDFAHVFVAAARHLGVPARYVGGYLFRPDLPEGQDAGHAWAEALIADLGWVAFDPANGISATDAYVRTAVGLDYLGAAPVRGTQYGGAGESLAVHILIQPSGRSPK